MTENHWNLLRVRIPREVEEAVSSLMFEVGATGTIILGEEAESIEVGAYFKNSGAAEEALHLLKAGAARPEPAWLLLGSAIEFVPDQDWAKKWKEGLEPIAIGRRLLIAPSWKMQLLSHDESRVVVQIDPGMAFGTGGHETTRLCLEALERHWCGGRLLDVGTGTGILAIAGALLSPVSEVFAIDVDPQAIEIAHENAEINRVDLAIAEGRVRDLSLAHIDVAVANLTAQVIVSELPDIKSCLSPGGVLIASGILSGFAADVEGSLTGADFEIVERRQEGEWVALVARSLEPPAN